MASSSSSTKVSLKLLIDTKNEKVLFAEASKSVIDFLFNLLCLPIGTVVKLLSTNGMVGSLGNLYASVENLNQNYMQPFQTKEVLLNPRAQSFSTEISGFLTQNDEGIKLYMCPKKCKFEVTNDNTTLCTAGHSTPTFGYPSCSNIMNSEVRYVGNRKVPEKRASSSFCNLFPTIDDDDDKPSVSSTGISEFLLVAELDKEDDEDYEEEEEDEDEDDEEDEEEEENLGCTLFFACPNKCGDEVTCDETTICSRCNIAMNRHTNPELNTKDVEENILIKNGIVNDYVTFLVMDDLVIQPMSTISVITLLNKFNVKEIGTLQEKVVEMGMDEGIKLLKASMQSKMVLTSVFLKKENCYARDNVSFIFLINNVMKLRT